MGRGEGRRGERTRRRRRQRTGKGGRKIGEDSGGD